MSDEPDLVSLLYRADWTRLSLTAEVTTTRNNDLLNLKFEGSPAPEPPGGPWPWPWAGPWSGSPSGAWPWAGAAGGPGAGPWMRPWMKPPRPPWDEAPDEPGPSGGDAWEQATEEPSIESDRFTLMIAPGGRYWLQGGSFMSGCDGERSWHAIQDDGGWAVEATGGPEPPPLASMLRPSWLLSGYTLEPGGPVTASGRDALRVVATPQPDLWHRSLAGPLARRRPLDRVELTVDTELSILLRHEEILDGKTLEVTELQDALVDPDPASDNAWCQPPGGWDSVGDSVPRATPNGPGWEVAKLAAGLAAGGLGALIRSSRFRPFEQATQEESEAEMPADPEPRPADGPPISDAVLHLLHASRDRWAPGITATLHQWHDIALMLSQVPDGARRTGFGGLGFLIDTAGERMATLHRVSRLSLGEAGQYRLEPLSPASPDRPGGLGRHRPETVVCDGERRWRIGEDEATAGPAGSPPREITDLFDASRLLEHRLTGGAEIMTGGRRGYRLQVGSGDRPWSWWFFPGEAVVDAELGVVLRWISFAGDQPVMRYELRDVTTGPLDPGVFQPDIPPGMRVTDESDGPVRPADVASVIAREARSAVRNLLDVLRGDNARDPES